MSVRSPTRLDARGVPIVLPTQSPQQSPRKRKQHSRMSRSAATADHDMDEVKLCQVRPKISTPTRQDRSLLDEHDEFTDACHRSHLNHISRMFYQGASSPNSWQEASTEPIPSSAKASPVSPASQPRQRRSPYGSPFQRLDAARQNRNKNPWISPTRSTSGNKRPLTRARPLNLSDIAELANKRDQSPTTKVNITNKKRRTLDFLALETNTVELSWPGSSTNENQLQHQFTATSPTQQSSQDQQTKHTKTHLPTPLSQPISQNTDITFSNYHQLNHPFQIPSPFLESKPELVQSTPLSPSKLDDDIEQLDNQPVDDDIGQLDNQHTDDGKDQLDDQSIDEDTGKLDNQSTIDDKDQSDNQLKGGGDDQYDGQPIDNDSDALDNQLIGDDIDQPDGQLIDNDNEAPDDQLINDDNGQRDDQQMDDVPPEVDDLINIAEINKTERHAPLENIEHSNVQLDLILQNQNQKHQPSLSNDAKQQTQYRFGIGQQQLSKTQDENVLVHQPSQQQQQFDHEQQIQQRNQKQSLTCVTDNQPMDNIQNKRKEKSQQTTTVENDSKDGMAHLSTASESKTKLDQQLAKKQLLQQEMVALTKSVKLLTTHYQLLDKIGCGTFSSVYKALDIRYDAYDNSLWDTKHPIPSAASPNDTTGENSGLKKSEEKRFVALKQIYATSSPKRMAQEIKILQHLRGAPCVSQLITAFRQQGHVFLVMPYFYHNEFKDCYRSMTMLDTKYYLKSLLTALRHLHSHRILHRDIKPNNFLYNIERKTGMLIDFGLAQREEETRPPEPPKSNSSIRLNMARKPSRSTSSITSKQKQSSSTVTAATSSNNQLLPTPAPLSPVSPTAGKILKSSVSKPISNQEDRFRKPGYIKHDPRKAIRANRAGTRGFRAPEVLLRVTHQTVAIDIWSVGVILLSLLSSRYPFFIGHDESDSLIEIASIFGMAEMKECAALHNRTFETNIETIPKGRKSFFKLCQVLNTEKWKSWSEDDRQNVQNAIDLLEQMLALDYRKRITAEDALKHPFLADSHLHPHPTPSSSPASSSPSYSSVSPL